MSSSSIADAAREFGLLEPCRESIPYPSAFSAFAFCYVPSLGLLGGENLTIGQRQK